MKNENIEKERQGLAENDHRRIGKELYLFSINQNVGSGLALWHPKGAIIREEIERFWKDHHRRHGYSYVISPESCEFLAPNRLRSWSLFVSAIQRHRKVLK